MSVPLLDGARVRAYLAALGGPEVTIDLAGLTALQAAHLSAVPFHNLFLLANDGRDYSLPDLREVVDGAIAGVGGGCDRTTPAFAALLEALGFDVHLAAATVREPGDHFVCIVDLAGARYLCDVGNGHPYLRPWRLDGPSQEQAHCGWHFRFEAKAPAGPSLYRTLENGDLRRVYVVDPQPREYRDFGPMVRAHHTRPGFGPFLGAIRAARFSGGVFLTLRDADYARDSRFGRSRRRVAGAAALRSLLVSTFGLPEALVADGLAPLSRQRPELLREPPWLDLGRGGTGQSETGQSASSPPRSEVPDVLVSIATIGRYPAVQRLLDSLDEEVRESGYPGRVGVLLVENHTPAMRRELAEPSAITIHRVPITRVQGALERTARLGLLPPPSGPLPLSAGAAREAQVALIHAHLAKPIRGVPHPAVHPTVVWMLDDDLVLRQLGSDGAVRRRTHLLYRLARYWATLTQPSVILGGFTGDPPVPGLDSLGGQLDDLRVNLTRMLELGHERPWEPPATPAPVADAYYDLAEAEPPPVGSTWPYAPNRRGDAVGDVALTLLRDLAKLLDGRQITRALTWDGEEAEPTPSLRRGGNTVFLDLDALFRWPTPALACADGVTTRRADTLWATIAQAEASGAVVEVTLPLHHCRDGQGPPAPEAADTVVAATQTASQIRGVVLARALSNRRDVGVALRAREARVNEHRAGLVRRIAELRDVVARLRSWELPEIPDAADEASRVLDGLAQLANGLPAVGDPVELERFLERVREATPRWQMSW